MIYSSGSKHWPKPLADRLWSWTSCRLDQIFTHIKPDTLSFWEGFFNVESSTSRCHTLPYLCFLRINFRTETPDGTGILLTGYLLCRLMLMEVLPLPVRFNQSYLLSWLRLVFAVNKTLAIFGILADCLGLRFNSLSDKYVNLLFDAANTGYAEVRVKPDLPHPHPHSWV